MPEKPTPNFPSAFVGWLQELAALSPEPNVTCQPLGIGLPEEYFDSPQGNPDITLGCSNIEQDASTGETILWHSVSYGPYGDPLKPEFEEEIESFGGWPEDESGEHFRQHDIDVFTWSLLNTLDQVLNGFLDSEHVEGQCVGLDDDYCNLLRAALITKLLPLTSLDCECGTFAREESQKLKLRIETGPAS